MVSALRLAATVFCVLSTAFARSSTGSKVLVVLEPKVSRDDYSNFFSKLESRGYELTFRAPKDVSPAAIEDDVPSFAHVILFTPTTKAYSTDLSSQGIIELLDARTNVLIALGPTQTPLHYLALEFGLTTAPSESALISHFAQNKDRPHNVLEIVPSKTKVVSPVKGPVLYSGTAFAMGNNPMQVPILRAPAEAYATDSDVSSDDGADVLVDSANKGGDGLWAGSSLGTVVGFQARNGARVTWVGGISLFNDEFAQAEVVPKVMASNAQVAQDIAAWTFQESLVYRIDNVTHHLVGGSVPLEHYTTNDRIEYEIHISRFDSESASWKPYSGIDDLQLEFTMLDPHIRMDLPPVSGEPGVYRASFRAPDRHGVFKFLVDWRRGTGESYLHSSITVPVVPPRHDGYPRFLSAAWPYYTGAISTSVGFVLFAALWLGGDVREAKKKTE
ncbi:Dolichyl-diphosphooligosaccharide-protein glycosyltransferase 48kDa subunit [Auriculariales sp. MPI-PUGE-AT-0066]|nr:Dolichyl-diphosphooligosaccharide-protein glycosyltransferase 48kDa subunit [Auriculariales sp. MPI-PUGE-AT-0066]